MPEPVPLKPAEPAPRKVKSAPSSALSPREYHNMDWRLTLPRDTRLEDLTNPLLYANVSDKFRTLDRLDAIVEGKIARVLVAYAQPGCAPVLALESVIEYTAAAAGARAEVPSGHEIVFDPATHSYTGVRTHDMKTGKPLDKPIPVTQPVSSREDCRRDIVNHASLRANDRNDKV